MAKPFTPAQMKRRTPYIVASSRWKSLKRGDHVMVDNGALLVAEMRDYHLTWRDQTFTVRLDEAAIGMSIARRDLQNRRAYQKLEQENKA